MIAPMITTAKQPSITWPEAVEGDMDHSETQGQGQDHPKGGGLDFVKKNEHQGTQTGNEVIAIQMVKEPQGPTQDRLSTLKRKDMNLQAFVIGIQTGRETAGTTERSRTDLSSSWNQCSLMQQKKRRLGTDGSTTSTQWLAAKTQMIK